ncbi:MAG: HNH endonuclease [Cellulomonadaceae bacterium]|nr:HNH endonuclease [Cellulomonadaceae bacterium]
MATSRTGTAIYRRNRAEVIAAAQAEGLTHCPGFTTTSGSHHECGVRLDYKTSKTPNSAEADHIQAVEHGGSDDVDNLRVICRRCNTLRNRKRPPTEAPPADLFPTLRQW